MKTSIRNLSSLSFFGLSLGAIAAPYLIPNGDFSIADGENWTQAAENAATLFTYPATDGNPNGYGRIDNSAGGVWAVLVQEGGTGPNPATGPGIPLGDLGLTAGETYTFNTDIKDFDAGANQAGLKIESWGTEQIGNSGDNLMPITSSWATYTIEYTIDAAATHLKFVPVIVAGGTGIIGFDNVGGDNTPVPDPPFVPDVIENGDFEIPAGASWGTTQGTPSFPTTGGNPNGHVILDGTSEFAVLYAFDNQEKTFASLGLSAGDTYTLNFDMMGAGGIRLEGPAGFVVETFPPLIGNGSTWESYSIELTVPESPDRAKFGLRPGGGVVAFDNVSINGNAATDVICIEIASGETVNWTPTSEDNSYQLQESANGVDYTDLGPLFQGTTVNSYFDNDGASFYRVQETSFTTTNDAVNGDFETPGAVDPFCPENWECITNDEQLPTLVNLIDDGIAPFEGDNSVQILVENEDGVSEANQSQLQQNVANMGGNIEAGASYDFSFQAKQISFGVSYVQQYRISWLAGEGSVLGEVGWFDFTGGDNDWSQISSAGIIAPAGATSALIQIFGTTGAVGSVDARGEVIIDDVKLERSESGEPTIIAATASEGLAIIWDSEAGQGYQVKAGTDLENLTDFGPALLGTGNELSVADNPSDPAKFYQVVEVETP